MYVPVKSFTFLTNILVKFQVHNSNSQVNFAQQVQLTSTFLNKRNLFIIFAIFGIIKRTCKIWDVNTGKCVETFVGHNDEVLDIAFNSTGTRLVTASADGTARVYNVHNGQCMNILTGNLPQPSQLYYFQ